MAELQIGVSDVRGERQCRSICDFGLRQLVGVAQFAGLFHGMAVLNPNAWITRISIKRLAVKLSGDLPLSAIPGLVGQGHCARLPAQQAAPLQVSYAVQCHSPSIRLRDRIRSHASEARSDAEEIQ